MKISIPELCLVVLIGPSGSGKSTFARTHFRPTEILSSDSLRGWVSDDETDQSATEDAFEVLHLVARKRLARGRLTVVDATNVQLHARQPLVAIAREHYVHPVAIVLDLPEEVAAERNRGRPDRRFGPHVLANQWSLLQRSLPGLEREGFRRIWVLRTPEEVAAVSIHRQRLRPNRKSDRGPFDMIGDIHGCADELEELLTILGYAPDTAGVWRHPLGRKAVFLGDLVDRGPRIPDVLRIATGMVRARTALCLPGNHDDKLRRWLEGRRVKLAHGLECSVEQLERETPRFRAEVASFLDRLVSHYVLDGGRLVVAHAGMKEEMQGRDTGKVRSFALYGETTGEVDEFGLPVRINWAAEYRGSAMVVYGHTPVAEPQWLNHTINIDTGCVFGGRLTALRYPERELVSVPARRVYMGSRRPFPPSAALVVRFAPEEASMLQTIDHGPVRELRFNRPPANALSPELISALRWGVESAPREGARALVLSGSPGRFSGGLDVPLLIHLDRDAIAAAWRDFYAMMRALAASPIPIAAAVTGHSPAGGAVISILCDARFMAEGDFRIGLNEVQVGIPLPPVIFQAFRRLVGDRQAERLSVSGQLIAPAEAHRIGLVDELVAPERVVERAVEWCNGLLALPPEAMSITRRTARAGLAALFEENEAELSRLVDQWFSAETQTVLRMVAERLTKKKA